MQVFSIFIPLFAGLAFIFFFSLALLIFGIAPEMKDNASAKKI